MIKSTTNSKLVIFLLISFSMQADLAFAKYSGGDGTAASPWQISNKADLLALGANTGDYGAYFIMTNDINLAGVVYTKALIASVNPYNLKPGFTGVFDGNSHTITGLTIDGSDYLGLFGYITFGCVKNLGLENVSISGSGGGVGSLVGYNGWSKYSGGSILNCFSTGFVSGNGQVGGLVGENFGYLWEGFGIISNCYFKGKIKGYCSVGGLVGSTCWSTQILNCYSIVDVNGVDSAVGGLVGYSTNYGNILDCYSINVINGKYDVGGLVGYNEDSTIWNCYSASKVVNANGEYFGGLVGTNYYGSIWHSFWDTEICGISTSAGGTGLTTSQMQQKSTYTTAPSDWDFINTWDIGENQTYPYLRQYPASDINQDKKTDYLDLSLLAENWLSGI